MPARQLIGLVLGLILGTLIWLMPLDALPEAGKRCLAITACVIIWWAFEVASVGYTSAALLLGYVLLLDGDTVPVQTVFKLWSTSTAYLIVGGFLIAAAVKNSGISKRFALMLLGRFARSYRDVIIICYVLSYLLSLIIPVSFARAFLILGAMSFLMEDAGMDRAAAANLGLAVCASQVGAGMLFMTGESMLNFALLEQIPAASRPGWLTWLGAMWLPAVLVGVMMCAIQLRLFSEPKTFHFDASQAREELTKMGPLSGREKRTLFWLTAAVTLWMTDRVHGIDLGWVSLGVAVMMAMPVTGGVLTSRDWSEINMGTLLFLTACVAVGSVGSATGMNQYLAALLMPESLSGGLMVFAVVTTGICFVLHLAMGSILTIFALVTPAVLALAASMGVNSLAAGLVVYIATAGQWIFPYQSMYITIGVGESAGGYSSSEAVRLGAACTVPTCLSILAALVWWKIIGLA